MSSTTIAILGIVAWLAIGGLYILPAKHPARSWNDAMIIFGIWVGASAVFAFAVLKLLNAAGMTSGPMTAVLIAVLFMAPALVARNYIKKPPKGVRE